MCISRPFPLIESPNSMISMHGLPLFQTTEVLKLNLTAAKIGHSNDSGLINLTVVTEGITMFQSSDNVYHMAELFVPEVRIYFLNMYPRHARRIMCRVSWAHEVYYSQFFSFCLLVQSYHVLAGCK